VRRIDLSLFWQVCILDFVFTHLFCLLHIVNGLIQKMHLTERKKERKRDLDGRLVWRSDLLGEDLLKVDCAEKRMFLDGGDSFRRRASDSLSWILDEQL